MYIRCLLLISAGLLIAKSEADDAVPQSSPATLSPDIPIVAAESLTEDEWADFVPISRDQLNQLMQQYGQQQTSIERTTYSARLAGTQLVDGKLLIELPKNDISNSFALGHTNFTRLKLTSNAGDEVPLASHSELGLIPLTPANTKSLRGEWSASGVLRGRSIVFDLKLPASDISSMTITTDKQTQVRSANAIVLSVSSSELETVWELLPASPEKLTIEFQRGNTDKEELAFLNVNGQMNLFHDGAQSTWSISVPKPMAAATVRFRVVGDVNIEAVRLGDSDIRWRRLKQQDANYLEVNLPQNISAPLSISGAFQLSADGKFQFPFLFPEVYFSDQNIERPISQRTSTIRVSVDSQIVVTDLQLAGLYKKDVSFAGNRNLVMEFEQFSDSASAVVAVKKALPLIQDAVVVKIESLVANVDASVYVRVTARSGNVNTLAWEVPRNWRVTDVRELGPDNPPLLYRLLDSSPDATQLEVTLRNPLSLNSASQTLIVRMQSVEDSPTSKQQPAGLFTSDYQRTSDQLALPESLARVLISSWATSFVPTDGIDTTTWLPSGTLTNLRVYSRSELKPVDLMTPPKNEIDATIDYSVNVNGPDIVETANIRLRSGEELPNRIPMDLSTDVVPDLTSDSAAVSLTRMTGGEDNQWVIELRPDVAGMTEVEFTLTAQCSLQSQTDGMAILLGNCRQGGRIVAPPEDSGITMAVQTETLSTVVSSNMEYPSQSFTLELVRSDRTIAPLQISGQSYVLISDAGSNRKLDAICRCLVNSSGRTHLEFTSGTASCDVLIAGRRVHAERIGSNWRVPLPEQQTPIDVDILLTDKDQTNANIELPLIEFPNSTVEVSWNLLAEPGQTIESGRKTTVIASRSSSVGALILPADLSARDAMPVLDFASRWMLRTNNQPNCVVIPYSSASRSTQLTIRKNASTNAVVFLFATAAVLFWRWLSVVSAWRCCAAIILLLGLRFFLKDASLFVDGLLWGTLAYAFFRSISQLRQRVLTDRGSLQNQTSKFAAGCLVFIVGPTIASAQTDISPPKIIAIGEASSVVYVQRSYLESLRQTASESSSEIAVLESQLDISMESAGTASARVSTTVARFSQLPQHLVLPLNDVTLIGCTVDGQKVFPKRDQAGNTLVTINNNAVLPETTLTAESRELASGPDTLGDWSIHTVEYEIRLATRISSGEIRLQVPFPLSPTTNITLRDSTGTISEPRIKTPLQEFAGTAAQTYSFPEVRNLASIDIIAGLTNKPESPPTVQNATVFCSIDVLPDRLITVTEYRLQQTQPDQTTVWVGATPEQIVSVSSATGRSLPWTAVDNGIEVTVTPDESGQQLAIVRQESDTSLSMTKTIAFKNLRLVNNKPATETTVLVRTSDQFIVDEILGDGAALQKIAVAVNNQDAPRSVARQVIVPPEVQSLSVSITELNSTQLVENISQRAVIKDDSIQWSCVFRAEISGQPAFRQIIMLPEDIRVDQVTATLVGTDRLQSWSRTRDSVVIFLREATRGSLEIQINGTVPRFLGKATSLPFAGFPPNVQVLQSSLALSSESSRGTFISSFGGARPDETFDTDQPLKSSVMRLSVIDDSRPMLVKELRQQSATISIAVLTYGIAGQMRTATAMLVKPEDATTPLRFRSRSNEIDSQKPILLRNNEAINAPEDGGVVTIPPTMDPSKNSSVVIVFPNGIPIARNDSLLIQTPEFDATTLVTSCVCYDLQTSTQFNQLNSGIPTWVSNAVKGLDLPPTANSRIQAAEFDPMSRRIQVRLPQQDQSQPETTAAPGVFYVDCEHFLEPNPHGVTGSSGFLVFASQSRSSFAVQIPDSTIATQLRVDGTSVPLMQHNGWLSVTLPSRISQITVDWIIEGQTNPGRVKQQLNFPYVTSTHGTVRATVKPAADRSRWWKIEAPRLPEEDFRESRTSSILTGLQMLEVESNGDPPPEFSVRSSMAKNLISQIFMQSANAARSADGMFARNEQPENLLLSINDSSLIMKDFRLPSAVVLVSLLIATVLLATTWLSSTTGRQTQMDTEASTIVTQANDVDRDSQSTVPQISSPEDLTAI